MPDPERAGGGAAQLRLGAGKRRVEVVFMDCDGVIFDVNAAKCEAFRASLDDYPVAAREALVAHHKAHGGVSRYDKFRHFFHHMHPVQEMEAAVTRALRKYGEASRRAYAALAPRPEALTFARRMGGRRRVYVVSGSDERELRAVFADHGIADRFAQVCGSPARKPEHIGRVLEATATTAAQALMVGDGRADFEAAQQFGMPFVFLAEMSEWADVHHIIGAAVARRQAFIAEDWAALLSWVAS